MEIVHVACPRAGARFERFLIVTPRSVNAKSYYAKQTAEFDTVAKDSRISKLKRHVMSGSDA